jgi:hypothetical protein
MYKVACYQRAHSFAPRRPLFLTVCVKGKRFENGGLHGA